MPHKLTPLMRGILETLRANYCDALTPNAIGIRMGVEEVRGGRGQGGRGRGFRNFGPAQRIIFPLNRLEALGLVDTCSRPDGMSGRAYFLTETGEAALREAE